jgi:serine/threonine protein kinase
MTDADFTALLKAVQYGEMPRDLALATLKTAIERSPESATTLRAVVDDLYGRNEIHFELYLLVRDTLTGGPSMRRTSPPPAQTAPPPDTATRLRAAPAADRTILRSTGHATGPAPSGSRPATATPTAPSSSATVTSVIEQPLEPGSIINNRFVLEQRLGEGGMGVVFKARDIRKEEAQDRNPYVAIKFLSQEFRRHPEALVALQRETRRAQVLAHPNVVTVYDFDRDGTLIYMTMEYLEGEPLDRYIARHPQGVRFKEAWPIIEGCSRALAYAHEQDVIHADFKPGNVFVSGQKRVKVLDFGIARAMHAHTVDGQGTRFDAGSLGGLTPAYASPEMFLGDQPDPRDDVYALACVSYELLTGRHPFNGVSAVKAAHDGMQVKRTPGMGRRQHRALVRGLAFRQSDRSSSVEAFLDEIAGPLGARGRAARQLILSTAGTALLVAGIGFSAWWMTRTDPDVQFMRQQMDEAKVRLEEEVRRRGEGYAPNLDQRDTLLELGKETLAMSDREFSSWHLSEGPSSAYGAFLAALNIDPTSEAAARGIVEVVRRYEAEAQRRYDSGDYAGAAELATLGLKIQPTRESLADLKRDAEAKLPAESK